MKNFLQKSTYKLSALFLLKFTLVIVLLSANKCSCGNTTKAPKNTSTKPEVPTPPRITDEMITAAKQGGGNALATILQNLKDGSNVDEATKNQALREAATLMNKDMFQALLDQGADPNPKLSSEQSKLYFHAAKGQEKYVEFLLQFPEVDMNVKYSGNQDNTPLHSASAWKDNKALKPLVDNTRTNINAMNALGETALHIAAQKGLIDSVKLLLSREDIDISIQDNAGKTPIDIATDPTIQQLLQNHKKDK